MLTLGLTLLVTAAPVVEAQEEVYRYVAADNGAGPLWCYGASCLARVGERRFISGLETIPGAKPLNNTRWVLYERTADGWLRRATDETGRTREPCPLVVGPGGTLLLSANPTLTPPDTYNGPARPTVFAFGADLTPAEEQPAWQGEPPFTEHSYRSFAADPATGEAILFNIVGHEHYSLSHRGADGAWRGLGNLVFPWGADYAVPEAIRLCYPEIVLRGRACHFLGISDIIEPNPAWREAKRRLTGQQWDYDFRRLFYTWSDDVTAAPFHDWIEVASRESTCGWIQNLDLWVADDGDVHLLWHERSCDVRLRDEFYPGTPLTYELKHAVLRRGEKVAEQVIVAGGEGLGEVIPNHGRFHVAPDGRLFVFATISRAGTPENRLYELRDGAWGEGRPVPFAKVFTSYQLAAARTGHAPSELLELYGTVAGEADALWYGRVRVE